MATISAATNPCGRSFLCYRRTAARDAHALIAAQRARGIPTWRDTDDLECQRTADALIRELDSPEIANVIWWLTPDVAKSDAILRLEAPRILRRVQADDAFFVEACLAGGLDWRDADRILERVPSLESLSGGWNLAKVSSPLKAADARAIAVTVLRRRVRAIIGSDERPDPLRLIIHTRGDAPLGYQRDAAFQIDWCSHFDGRCARAGAWSEQMLPALADIVSVLHENAPDRTIEASGLCCLAAAFALGRAFMEPSGLRLVWRQQTRGTETLWSLDQATDDGGFTSRMEHTTFDGTDLAILVNVRGDVEPAVRESIAGLPRFSVITRIWPDSEKYPASIDTPGQAVHLARLVAESIRLARTEFSYLRRTHVFLSGPAGLAVLIGQQLNGLGPLQTYEHLQSDGAGRYVPAALLVDQLTQGSST